TIVEAIAPCSAANWSQIDRAPYVLSSAMRTHSSSRGSNLNLRRLGYEPEIPLDALVVSTSYMEPIGAYLNLFRPICPRFCPRLCPGNLDQNDWAFAPTIIRPLGSLRRIQASEPDSRVATSRW